MSKLSLVLFLGVLSSFGVINTASAQNVSNFGQCMSSVETSLKSYQAPGKSGNGPLNSVTTKKGIKTSYGSFDGGQGCTVQ